MLTFCPYVIIKTKTQSSQIIVIFPKVEIKGLIQNPALTEHLLFPLVGLILDANIGFIDYIGFPTSPEGRSSLKYLPWLLIHLINAALSGLLFQ